MNILHYDGSFDGFLTAVFQVYADKIQDARIRKKFTGEIGLWGDNVVIETEPDKAARVWNGIVAKSSKEAARTLYLSYLSEIEGEEDNMLAYVRHVLAHQYDASKDYSHPAVLRAAKVSKMVHRERHRMEAFVRFRLADGQLYHAVVEPDFNVLPLIARHFKDRYADQRWCIFDLKRHYGLYYDLKNVELVSDDQNILPGHEQITFMPEETAYQQLWKNYFNSTHIRERRNTKLHIQHVPVRYWKYLSEKQP